MCDPRLISLVHVQQANIRVLTSFNFMLENKAERDSYTAAVKPNHLNCMSTLV